MTLSNPSSHAYMQPVPYKSKRFHRSSILTAFFASLHGERSEMRVNASSCDKQYKLILATETRGCAAGDGTEITIKLIPYSNNAGTRPCKDN